MKRTLKIDNALCLLPLQRREFELLGTLPGHIVLLLSKAGDRL